MENFDKENKKDRQIDNLINLVENHTRTERHLEQYSEIGDERNKEHAREIQGIREEQIDELRDKLNGKDVIQTKAEQLRNLENKYEDINEYIENNKWQMTEEALDNVETKQEHRKEQIENLKNN